MSTVETVTLGGHIVAGFLALFAGLGALATKKGGTRHRQSGRVYVYSMAVVSGTALALYPMAPGPNRLFLALVAIFSFYFAFSGYRVLSRKRPADGPTVIDWVAVGLLGLSSAGILAMGGRLVVTSGDFAIVMLVFGSIGAGFAVLDVLKFHSESEPGDWITEHITRMGAGYIATVTAFSTVNFTFLPPVARWLWPTILGSLLIAYFTRKYEKRFTPGPAD